MFRKKRSDNVLKVYEGCVVDQFPCIRGKCGHPQPCLLKAKIELSHDKRGLKREIIDENKEGIQLHRKGFRRK